MKLLEHKISWKILKVFAQKCSYVDLGLTLIFFYGKVIFAFQAFIWEELMELVEDLVANINKYS